MNRRDALKAFGIAPFAAPALSAGAEEGIETEEMQSFAVPLLVTSRLVGDEEMVYSRQALSEAMTFLYRVMNSPDASTPDRISAAMHLFGTAVAIEEDIFLKNDGVQFAVDN